MKGFITLVRRYFFVFDEPPGRWLLVLSAIIATAVLDVFGIGALGLFIQAIVAPEAVAKLPVLPELLGLFGADPGRDIMIIGLLSFAFFLARTLIAYLLQVYLLYFNSRKQVRIQQRLFCSYLHAPLLFRKERNFARMLYNVNFLSDQFIYLFSNGFFSLAANGVLFVVIAAFLSATNLLASAVICALFILAAGAYYMLIKDRSSRYGRLWAQANELQIKHIREGIGALDEIQILGCQDHFNQQVKDNLNTSLKYRMRRGLLEMIPRPLAEFLLLSFLILFALGYQLYVGSITEISALIGIFGMAGIRMVPAASHISASINGMKHASFAVHQLYDEMQALAREGMLISDSPARAAGGSGGIQREVRINAVSFTYPDSTEPVLRGFSATIRKGERVAIVGKSGSGKTTLLNILLGNIKPGSGSVEADGAPIMADLAAWRSSIFYLPQTIYLLDDSIRRNVALGVSDAAIDEARLRWALDQAQLGQLVDKLPQGLDTMVGDQGTRLSGGQRQRIGIARALYHGRDIIIMDEATSALDDETEAEVKESLRKLPAHVTVIMITHSLRKEDIFDQVIRIG